MAIESRDYQDTRDALRKDPIIQMMAAVALRTSLDELAWDDGTPRGQFMMAASDTYHAKAAAVRAAGKGTTLYPADSPMHLGACAEAILALRAETIGNMRYVTELPDTTPEAEVIAAFDALRAKHAAEREAGHAAHS